MAAEQPAQPIRKPDRASPVDALLSLSAPELDPLFWPSTRPLALSAWFGHVPFAHWLVTTTRPASIVELGTQDGASYCAFCEAVLNGRLGTHCFAVDTWEGDAQSGRYGADVLGELRQFHDPRYGQFSSLIRAPFAAAARRFEPGSVDLLHIDGLHTYAAVRGDFETWLPKMSQRGVMLLHDIGVQMDGFEVGKLWGELQQRYPSFGFAHSYGLGVVAVGAAAPAPVLGLCRLDEAAAERVRARFARLGELQELRAGFLKQRLSARPAPARPATA